MPKLRIRYRYLCTAPFFGRLLWMAFASLAVLAPVQAEQYDVVVYGGTSAAVTAAVEAARMGKSVVIVSPDHRLGGLTSNGLGWTDIGSRDSIGGLSREFYNRIYDYYLDDDAWALETRQNYTSRTYLDPDNQREMMFTFEPKVAEQVFDDLVAEHNIPVVAGHLDRANGVAMSGQAVSSISTVEGGTFQGKAFIDATYEGDLMAAAGVSYTVGREANSRYNESLNGIQTANSVKNQLPAGIDPYVVAGDPSSGLLPGVNSSAGGVDGKGDLRLQAYNYRMVLSNNPANRTPVLQPDNYNEADYEILFRAIEAGQSDRFFKLSPMPNNKTDSNNDSGISTDFIGGNYCLETGVNYAEADYATREQMEQVHREFQIGFVWTLQNHPRIPSSIRNAWDDWGLPLDEFTDNGHWPNQIYVREARRMVSDFVINEHHVNQEEGFEQTNSVGMGGYNMDSHNVQRYVDDAGHVQNEGDVQVAPAEGPYPISYDAMVPRPGEASNLLVPVAVSASHIAYGSLRMEPVFMTLGQSAGAAASLISERSIASQDLPYALLRSRLVRGRQVLGAGYVSNDPGILLNFGATVSDDDNSPGHLLGGIPGESWNVITGDTSAGIVDSNGGATSLSVDLGKSAPGVQSIDWNAAGYNTLSSGSAFNTDIYAGNASSALFVNDGKGSQVDLGVRISGLSEGTYDVFLTAKNTNTSVEERYNIYGTTVQGSSSVTSYGSLAPSLVVNETSQQWFHEDSFLAQTISVADGEDLVLVVEGITVGEMRGFLNTLEIVKLSGVVTADVDGNGSVDIDDFLLIRSNYLQEVSLGTDGDANSDGIVNHKDFYMWRTAFVAQGGDLSLLNNLDVPTPAAVTYPIVFAPLAAAMRYRAQLRIHCLPLLVEARSSSLLDAAD